MNGFKVTGGINCSLHDLDQLWGNATIGIFIEEEKNRNKKYGGRNIKVVNWLCLVYIHLMKMLLIVIKKLDLKSFGEEGAA